MNILLVQPMSNWGYSVRETPSRALLTLGTIASRAGHNVKIVHQAHQDVDSPDNFTPDIVGITCNTFQVKEARRLVSQYSDTGAGVVLGGPHAGAWEKTDQRVRLIVGPGEKEWASLIGAEHTDGFIQPDYSLVDLSQFVGVSPVGAWPSVAIMSSFGCPYSCVFCNTPLFWGNKVVRRPTQDVISEISHLHYEYGAREIFFQDDTFNLNLDWATEILEGIISAGLNKSMLFKLACRANEKLITKSFLDTASRAGVWNIFYGVESGSQMMLNRMHKGIKLEEIKRAFKLTHEAGIQTQASFIVGLPGESKATLRETIKFITRLQPTIYGWAHACPFPGTEFEKHVKAEGHLRDLDYAEYGYGLPLVRTDELSFEFLSSFPGL